MIRLQKSEKLFIRLLKSYDNFGIKKPGKKTWLKLKLLFSFYFASILDFNLPLKNRRSPTK
jgi:hypothetical protein